MFRKKNVSHTMFYLKSFRALSVMKCGKCFVPPNINFQNVSYPGTISRKMFRTPVDIHPTGYVG